MYYFRPIYITCRTCGHRNRPHASPLESAILLLQGWQRECYGCGKLLKPRINPNRPIYARAQSILEQRQQAAS